VNAASTLPPSAPRYTFPTFFLSLLTALEADPASIPNHLSNLANSHASLSCFVPDANDTRPQETDAIVGSLERIAKRLQVSEKGGVSDLIGHEFAGTINPAECEMDSLSQEINGATIKTPEEMELIRVKRACRDNLTALKIVII
jgi:hypothetical protein